MFLFSVKNILRKSVITISMLTFVSLLFSFSNLFISSNYCLPHETIANNISICKKNNNYVHFELEKHYGNYIYSEKYHFNKFAQIVGYQNLFIKDNSLSGFSFNNITLSSQIDTLGVFDLNGNKAPSGFKVLFSDDRSFDIDEKTCLVSYDLAIELMKVQSVSDFNNLFGQRIANQSCGSFIISGIIDSDCLGTRQNLVNSLYICTDFSNIVQNDISYSLHFFLTNKYATNSSAFNYAFSTFFDNRLSNYLTVKVDDGNEWLIDEISSIVKKENKLPFLALFIYILISIFLGILTSYVNQRKGCRFERKEFFFLNLFIVLLFFGITFFFEAVFNHLIINGVHINTTSSVSSLFQLLVVSFYIFSFVVATKKLFYNNSTSDSNFIKIEI